MIHLSVGRIEDWGLTVLIQNLLLEGENKRPQHVIGQVRQFFERHRPGEITLRYVTL